MSLDPGWPITSNDMAKNLPSRYGGWAENYLFLKVQSINYSNLIIDFAIQFNSTCKRLNNLIFSVLRKLTSINCKNNSIFKRNTCHF